MRKRTQHLQAAVDMANRMLADSTCSAETRRGIIALTDSMLFAAGQYRGFSYLTQNEVPEGQEPGIRRHPDSTTDVAWNEYPDETRRHYY